MKTTHNMTMSKTTDNQQMQGRAATNDNIILAKHIYGEDSKEHLMFKLAAAEAQRDAAVAALREIVSLERDCSPAKQTQGERIALAAIAAAQGSAQ